MPHFQGTLAGIVASNRWASEQKEQLQVNRRAGLQRANDAYFARRR